MALYTFRIDGRCAGGAHVRVTILKDGKDLKSKIVLYEDIMTAQLDIDEAMLFFFRQAIKSTDAKTATDMKDSVEKIQVVA